MKYIIKKIMITVLLFSFSQLFYTHCLGVTPFDEERIAIEGRLRDRLVKQIRLIAKRERNTIIGLGRQVRRELAVQEQGQFLTRELRRQEDVQRQVLDALEQAKNYDIGMIQRLMGMQLIDAAIVLQQKILFQDRLQ